VHLAGAVAGQHGQRRRGGGDAAQLRDGDGRVGQDLQQERLELLIRLVDFVDQQDGAARLLQRLVEGMRQTEPVTFAMMVCVLVVAALIASFVPARRASRVDPVTALRQE